MLRHTHPNRATGPLVFNDTNSVPHQPRRADNRRDEAFTNAGWSYFKANADDLAEGFSGLIVRIKRAKLRTRGRLRPVLGGNMGRK
ncbi:hypothetical protein AHiyo8_48780 [Arthrobacter sp. Hiyo8]|nr:hypothetical protein AHiyo8_48780 [Arthrobacter sp. Hiyo8]